MEKSGEHVLRKADLRPYPTTALSVVYVWVCPHCNKTIMHNTQRRTLYAARLHLQKKHGVAVRVEE